MITTPFGSEEPKTIESQERTSNGFFDRMRQAVSRTRESFSAKIADLAALTRTVDESALEELETALLTSDLGVQTTTAILDALRDRARHQAIEGGAELRDLLEGATDRHSRVPRRGALATPQAPPKVTFLVGVNGTGKTTSSGKLAAWCRAQGRSVLLCAADTFRAAAIEQLEVWAARSGVEMIKTRQGGDPAAVLFDAIAAAKARDIDELYVDTAGRLHTKTGLMDELDKMRRTAARLVPGAPHEVLLVMDATTGQNGLQQARLFTQSAGVTGIRAHQTRRHRQGRHRRRHRPRAESAGPLRRRGRKDDRSAGVLARAEFVDSLLRVVWAHLTEPGIGQQLSNEGTLSQRVCRCKLVQHCLRRVAP